MKQFIPTCIGIVLLALVVIIAWEPFINKISQHQLNNGRFYLHQGFAPNFVHSKKWKHEGKRGRHIDDEEEEVSGIPEPRVEVIDKLDRDDMIGNAGQLQPGFSYNPRGT